MGLSLLRKPHIYQAIKEENETYGYPISALCKIGKVSRAGYYKWLNRAVPANEGHNKSYSGYNRKNTFETPG